MRNSLPVRASSSAYQVRCSVPTAASVSATPTTPSRYRTISPCGIATAAPTGTPNRRSSNERLARIWITVRVARSSTSR